MRTADQNRQELRIAVRHFYDIQTIRIQHSNRIAKKAKSAAALISDEQKAMFAAQVKRLKATEAEALDDVIEHLKLLTFYKDVLDQDDPRWKGLGPTMSGVILAEVDIGRANNVSQLWRYAGLSTVPWKRCKHCHRLADMSVEAVGEYADGKETGRRFLRSVPSIAGTYKHMNRKVNEAECKLKVLTEDDLYDSARSEFSIKDEKRHYNLFLKTKLLGVLGTGFLRCNNEVWRKVYDDYKHRLVSAKRGTSDGHVHNSSLRYMVKMFLLELWKEWRTYEGLPVRPTYQEEKLGHMHHAN